MNMTTPRRIPAIGLLAIVLVTFSTNAFAADAMPKKIAPDQLDFFESKIRPLLVEHCYECHSHETGQSEGDLFIDSAAAIRRGGASGPLIRDNNADKSLLMRVIRYDDRNLQMPPDSKLPADSIELLRQWITMGAPDPREENAIEASASPLDRDPSTHWAFVKPQRAAPPVSDGSDRDRVDTFAVAKTRQANIPLSEPASKEVLVRRLYFDLTGLVPTKSQIDAFVSSSRPDAYVRLVDQLLASPEFGERFGRHWLDVSRYADTVGYALGGKERRINGSHRYRDWAIRAFAADMPYDEMIRHQLAGDRTDPENKNGNLDAMGFLTIGRRFLSQYDTWDDRIDVITRGLQGMTVTCARCHDHKFDPIPAADYYSLLGVLQSSKEKADGPSPLMMVDENPHDTHVLLRGQQGNRGPIAPRQFLTSLRKPDEPKFSDGSGRLELANRIADSNNPLTARVLVNRVWSHLIGKSLVDSPSDFGFRTTPPAIPEILDDLAADFASHWSIKRLVKRIVITRIYQQSSSTSPAVMTADPDNSLLTRGNRRRRDFESMRDSMLQIADSLRYEMGGEPVEITLPSPSPRRTVYAMIDRQNLPSLFRTFDFASPDAHSPERYFTTVPQQALYLLNDRQSTELARRTAVQIRRDSESNDANELAQAVYRRVLQRDANGHELAWASEYLSRAVSPAASLTDPRSLWSYGVADVNERFAIKNFRPMRVFKGGHWQTADQLPNKDSNGYASLTKDGGHPGHTNAQSVVRRWQSPATGTVRAIGTMGHRGEQGDGVRTTILVNNKSIFSGVQVRNNRPFGPVSARIEAGQFLDLVASPGEHDSFDSYFWKTQIRLSADDGRTYEADSAKDFSGPFKAESSQPLDRLAQLAQVLLICNEFAFVD
ncbi:MAG: PSD1 and planctomycete cytochrome C domain-containing protein [Pirellulaceae bacterium]